MPCAVTAFNVNIASPGDAGMELILAREVIADWNAAHALKQRRLLLPLHHAPDAKAAPGDLLVAFYCATTGSPVDRDADATEAEIENHLRADLPALVYFSEARVNLSLPHALPGHALDEFQRRYPAATIDSYGDEKEFRAKFARQLEATIAGHAHFRTEGVPSPTAMPASPAPAAPPPDAPLTTPAQTILIEACDDFEGYIGRLKIGNTLKIQANGKQLVEQNNPEAAVKWEGAFQELLTGGYIRDAGCNGQLFQITTKGFGFLKTVGKSPVGYIAELGGM